LIYANRGKKLDSLDALYQSKIGVMDAIIIQKDKQLQISQDLIQVQSNEIVRYQRREKLFAVGIGASLLAVILLAIFK
jgi:hypothetical protein